MDKLGTRFDFFFLWASLYDKKLEKNLSYGVKKVKKKAQKSLLVIIFYIKHLRVFFH